MIQVKELFFSYAEIDALQRISFTVQDGEFVGIIGPNGAGKSTLLKILDGIYKFNRGEVRIHSRKLSAYSAKTLARIVGFVPQQFTSAFDFTAYDVVMMGRFPYQKFLGMESEEDFRIVEKSMNLTDCFNLRERKFHSLSGGEQKRIVLASALAQEPKILLLDEPTSALDLKHQIHFYNILKMLQLEKKMTILSVTHDINLAAQFCNRIIALKAGQIIADDSTTGVLNQAILEKVYDIPLEVIRNNQNSIAKIFPKIQ